MLVSIITPTFNSSKTILRCCNSIDKQDHDKIEHIIVDGLSDDETLQKLKGINRQGRLVFSEHDLGIYDAINKGVERSSGDIIAILNSDDWYADHSVVSDVVKAFELHGTDCVYGNLSFLNSNSVVTRVWKPGEFSKIKLVYGWMIPHPTFFLRRRVWEKSGTYSLNYRISSDYDYMLRVLRKAPKVHYLCRNLVNMQLGGVSTSGRLNALQKYKEDYSILKKHYYFAFIVACLKRLHKLPQSFNAAKRSTLK